MRALIGVVIQSTASRLQPFRIDQAGYTTTAIVLPCVATWRSSHGFAITVTVTNTPSSGAEYLTSHSLHRRPRAILKSAKKVTTCNHQASNLPLRTLQPPLIAQSQRAVLKPSLTTSLSSTHNSFDLQLLAGSSTITSHCRSSNRRLSAQ